MRSAFLGTIDRRRAATGRRAARIGLVALGVLCSTAPPAGGRELRVEGGDGGEIALAARNVSIAEALTAVSTAGGFEVAVAGARGRRRPPANLVVPMAPLERVLRELLRGRNYAIVYDAAGAPSQVILLPPSDPRRTSRPPPRKRPARRPPGPTVVVR